MDIIFFGGVFPKSEEKLIHYKSKGTVQFAANALQWNLIDGLDACNSSPVTILNSIFVGSYPKHYSDVYVKSSKWSHTDGSSDINVGFLNLFGIKQIWRGFAITNSIRDWAKKETKEQKVIIIYSMNTAFIKAAQSAKEIDANIHICLICPDLPEFMNLGNDRRVITNILTSFDMRIMKLLLECVDSFVLLTKYMAERIDVGNRPWIVMEGIVNSEKTILKQELKESGKKVVLYSGTLNKAYGILELLEAFKLIDDPSIHLWICGAGEAQPEVESLAENDTRVKYFGQVKREYAVELQQEADIVINPRSNKGEYTKFSFPSKIMEYMHSGTPALIYKLDGIPNEYYEYLYIIEVDSPDGIARSICEVCSKSTDELKDFGAKARNFVLSEKSHTKQAHRIIDLIEENKKE